MSRQPVSCLAFAVAGADTYALRFELHNSGTAPVELPSYEPFTAFSMRAYANGRTLTVHQPALDIPVRRRHIHLPPNGGTTIVTPIQLRIAENAEPGSDGFIWTISHAAEGMSIDIELHLPAPFDTPCRLRFE